MYGALLLIVVAIGFVLFQGLNNAALYYRNADEAVHDKASLGTRRFRVQGTVQPDVAKVGQEVDFTIVFNFQNVTNYMYVNFGERDEATANGIFRVVNSVRTKIGTFGTTVTAPGTARRIRVQRVGASIKVFRDGTQIGPTVNDATFTGGQVGVGSRNNAATFDNFFVEKN